MTHVLVVVVFMVDIFIMPCSFISCSIRDLDRGGIITIRNVYKRHSFILRCASYKGIVVP
jgi:hypothetical protein